MADELNVERVVASMAHSSRDQFDGLLHALFQARTRLFVAPEQQVEFLKDALKRLQNKTTFSVGDVVTWKQGLKDRTYPAVNAPAIVVKVLETPVVDPMQDASSSAFGRLYDLICAVQMDGTFNTFYFDGARLEHFSPVQESSI